MTLEPIHEASVRLTHILYGAMFASYAINDVITFTINPTHSRIGAASGVAVDFP